MLGGREIWNDAFEFHVPLQSLVKLRQVVQLQPGLWLPPAGNLPFPPFKLAANSADFFTRFDLPRGVAHPHFAV
jgi:hypothetical protein